MTTAVDTSVVLDLSLNDRRFGEKSEAAIRSARNIGRLIVCETVIAEISPAMASRQETEEFLLDMGLEFVPSTNEVALLAGDIFKAYIENKGQAKRVVPDFFVAAHASVHADALLARDRGYYREYFKDVALVQP